MARSPDRVTGPTVRSPTPNAAALERNLGTGYGFCIHRQIRTRQARLSRPENPGENPGKPRDGLRVSNRLIPDGGAKSTRQRDCRVARGLAPRKDGGWRRLLRWGSGGVKTARRSLAPPWLWRWRRGGSPEARPPNQLRILALPVGGVGGEVLGPTVGE